MFTVEIRRFRHGNKDEEEAAFNTREEAVEWAQTMLLHYGYHVWIDGVAYTREDIKCKR